MPGSPLNGSGADFFGRSLSVNHDPCPQSSAIAGAIPGSNVMTFVGRLSVIAAYLAMAFVGAIVLGMI
ncbi:hypothetical protein FXV83_27175 [Bradyrhizobium hipponense]|uniref:Uncharacterized protein n=1 Tax=Bradyrhizobium hipponense TaxID=2605638 RepID=A0A5S4YGE6_9BRAD|nr:hypothetical protein FXV83_27175 [Bradyrhizobium hipponense]